MSVLSAGLAARLRDAGRGLWRWLFPPEIELPEGARRAIARLLPALDLDRVSFHRGMPHFVRGPHVSAMTLPSPFSRRTRIYVEPRCFDPESAEGLGTLIHEAYHALQAQESGAGFGPFRPFLVLYFAVAAAHGFRYRGHPMEEAAYGLAGRRHSRFEAAFPDWQGDWTALDREGDEGGGPLAALAEPAAGVSFWRDFARSVPLVRRLAAAEPLPAAVAALVLPLPVAAWLLVWAAAVAVVWLARVLVEALGAAAALLLWGLGSVLSIAEFGTSR